MLLYHFSEDPNIAVFHPRKLTDDAPPLVWAIDEEHSVNYLFPRDCPRIIFSKSERMSLADRDRYFSGTGSETVIAVESGWLERIRRTTLYKYIFSDETFELQDATAGYYVSNKSVTPLQMEPVSDLLDKIVARGVELRITPKLYPLRASILASTIDDFSIIRFRNAKKE